jgi:hypothetical protein
MTKYATLIFGSYISNCHEKKEGMYLVSATPPKQIIGFL